ncbi:hypothetical protein KM043_002640 [Ampulex compressa]|nr:hypothetical protein KM043_002640 [Ampulex compressa]
MLQEGPPEEAIARGEAGQRGDGKRKRAVETTGRPEKLLEGPTCLSGKAEEGNGKIEGRRMREEVPRRRKRGSRRNGKGPRRKTAERGSGPHQPPDDRRNKCKARTMPGPNSAIEDPLLGARGTALKRGAIKSSTVRVPRRSKPRLIMDSPEGRSADSVPRCPSSRQRGVADEDSELRGGNNVRFVRASVFGGIVGGLTSVAWELLRSRNNASLEDRCSG